MEWKKKTYVKILLLISMVLNDSGAMPRHGYIIIAVYPGNTFHLYLKEIEFRFNHADEDLLQVLANIVVKAVPKS
jgi:hypothetical protein